MDFFTRLFSFALNVVKNKLYMHLNIYITISWLNSIIIQDYIRIRLKKIYNYA